MLVGMLFGDQVRGGKGVIPRMDGDDILLGGWNKALKAKGQRCHQKSAYAPRPFTRASGARMGDDDVLLGANMFTRGARSIGKGLKKAALSPVRVFTSAKSPLDLVKRVAISPYTITKAVATGVVVNPVRVSTRTLFSATATAGRFTGSTTRKAFTGTGHILANVGRGTGSLAKSGLKIVAPVVGEILAAKMGLPQSGPNQEGGATGGLDTSDTKADVSSKTPYFIAGGVALLGIGYLVMKKK